MIEENHRNLPQRQRLFVDMDGTLAEFKNCDTLETLYEQGYFANLKPLENVVEAIRQIIREDPSIEVFILSSCLSDSPYAQAEKNQWLDRYLPEIDADHRLFPPCGVDKKSVVSGGIRPTDVLLDDYTTNLLQWEPPARGLKVLNGINHTHGTWDKAMVSANLEATKLAEAICMVVRDSANVQEQNPTSQTASTHKTRKSQSKKDTNPQICQAIKAHFDLVEYAQSYGLTFKERCGKYQCVEMDSMWIDPVQNLWVRHSAAVGGSIIDFVMYYDKVSMDEAISKLRKEMGCYKSYDCSRYEPERIKQQAKEESIFEAPKKVAGGYRRLFAYLTKARGISGEIVSDLVRAGVLYEDTRHNCVFLSPDYDGQYKGCSRRGTSDTRYFQETGQKLGWMVNPHKAGLFITEAPIDAMSLMTMLKIGDKDYRQYSFYAQCGNSQATMLKHHITHNPEIQTVYLCFDNDTAGRKFDALARQQLQEMGFCGEVITKTPIYKDFNQDLKEIPGHGLEIQKAIKEDGLCMEK